MSVTLGLGQTQQMSAQFLDGFGATLRGIGVPVWSSSNPSVAPVNSVGVVSALSAGSAIISASLDGIIGTSAITVNPFVIIASDSFARGDSAVSLGTADIGGAWTPLLGTWGISGNQAYNAVDAGGLGNVAYLTTVVSDCSVSTTFVQTPASTSLWLPVRIVDASNFIVLTSQTPSTVQVYRFVAGSPTQIFTSAYNWSNGDVPMLTMLGTTFTVFVNGVQKGSPFTESNFSTAVKHGIGSANGTGTANRWDNFLITAP